MEDEKKLPLHGTAVVLFRGGGSARFRCTKVSTERNNSSGNLTSISFEGLIDRWVYLRLDAIDAVLWDEP